MARRFDSLEKWLVPASEKDVLAEVSIMFRVLAHRAASQGEAGVVLRSYWEGLSGFPLFAVSEACRAFRLGDAGDGKWAPTIKELRDWIKARLEPMQKEKYEIGLILSAIVDAPIDELRPFEIPLMAAQPELEAERRKFVADRARAAMQARDEALENQEARSSGKTLPPSRWDQEFAKAKLDELKLDKEPIRASDELLEKLSSSP